MKYIQFKTALRDKMHTGIPKENDLYKQSQKITHFP